MFDPFLEELHTSIHDHGGKQLDIPDEFKEYKSPSNNSKIQNWLWDVPGFRRWRVTRLDSGENLQVLNSVAYPSYNKDQPIMGIDLLWFGKRGKLVAVLDFQPLIQDEKYFEKYFEGLKSLKNTFPKFNNQKNMFLYDPNKYFSPWVLFCRGSIDEAEGLLPTIFSSFVDCYWKLDENLKNNNYILSKEQVERFQKNYDEYSAEKDPAHNLFSSFFGQKWSDRFLREFLFPLC